MHAVVLCVLSVLVFLSHLFTFALLAGSIGWIRLFETLSWRQAFQSALTATWPGWLLVGDYLWLNSGSSWINQNDTYWLPLHWSAEFFFREYFRSVSESAYRVALAAWAWAPILLVWGWRQSGRSILSAARGVLAHPIGSLILFLGIAYFALPYHVLGWHKVNVRLVPFILGLLLVGLASLPGMEIAPALRRVFVSTIAATVVIVTALIIPEVIRMDAAVKEYVSGIDQFEANSSLLPIHLENPAFGGIVINIGDANGSASQTSRTAVGGIRPLTRAHEYYHLAKGGANGCSIPSLNTLSIMWYREYPVTNRFPAYDADDPKSLEAIRRAYDFVLVYGEDPRVVNQIESLGFKLVHHQGHLRLFKNSERGGGDAVSVVGNGT